MLVFLIPITGVGHEEAFHKLAHRILVFLEEQEVEVVGEEGAFQYDDVLLVPRAVGQTSGVWVGFPPILPLATRRPSWYIRDSAKRIPTPQAFPPGSAWLWPFGFRFTPCS